MSDVGAANFAEALQSVNFNPIEGKGEQRKIKLTDKFTI